MSDNQRKGRPSNRGGTRPGSSSRRRPRTPRDNGSVSSAGASGGATAPVEPQGQRRPRPASETGERDRARQAPGPKPRESAPRPARSELATRIRRFGLLAAATDGVAVLAIVTLAILVITIGDLGLTPFPASVADAWMVLNMTPVIVNGITLGVVPAVPAMLFVAVVAWRTRKEVSGPISVRDIRVLTAFSLGVPLALTLGAWLLLWDASRSTLIDVEAPSLVVALVATLILRLVALAVGIGPKLLTALLRRRRLPEWPIDSLRLGADLVVCLWGAAAVVVLVAAAVRFSAVADAYSLTDGPAGVIGFTVTSLLYLPNAAAATVGVLTGAQAYVGVAEVGLFGVIPGALPPLPLLGAVPQEHHQWFVVLLAVPVAVVVWRVWRYLVVNGSDGSYQVVVLAALISGVFIGALAWLTGGELGYFGETGTQWWLAGILASVWIALPAALTVVVVRGFPEVFGKDRQKLPDVPVPDTEPTLDDGDEPEEVEAEEIVEAEEDSDADEAEADDDEEEPELEPEEPADDEDEALDDEEDDGGEAVGKQETADDEPRNPGERD